MEKVREYRTRAAECRVLSVKGPTPEIRELYRNLADMWDQLTDQRVPFFVVKNAIDEVG
jgi:hypothetical protein